MAQSQETTWSVEPRAPRIEAFQNISLIAAGMAWRAPHLPYLRNSIHLLDKNELCLLLGEGVYHSDIFCVPHFLGIKSGSWRNTCEQVVEFQGNKRTKLNIRKVSTRKGFWNLLAPGFEAGELYVQKSSDLLSMQQNSQRGPVSILALLPQNKWPNTKRDNSRKCYANI